MLHFVIDENNILLMSYCFGLVAVIIRRSVALAKNGCAAL